MSWLSKKWDEIIGRKSGGDSSSLFNTSASLALRPYGSWQPGGPGVEDISATAHQDRMVQSGLAQEDTANRRGALDDMRASLRGVGEATGAVGRRLGERGESVGRGAADRIRRPAQEANASGQRRLRSLDEGFDVARGSAKGHIQTALDNLNKHWGDFHTQLTSDRSSLDRMVNTIWDKGGKALSEFRTTMGEQMGAWVTGNQEATRANKEERARTLAAQGFRPEEIEGELRKMDVQNAQTQAGKVAEFGIAEEMGRRNLQVAYDTLGQQTEIAASEARTQLTSVEGSFRSSMETLNVQGADRLAAVDQWWMDNKAAVVNAQNGLDTWEAEMSRTAELSALDTQTKYELAGAQYEVTGQTLEMSGMTSWATLWQDFESSYVPMAPALTEDFALRMALMSQYFGDSSMMLSLVQSSSANQSAALQALGMPLTTPMG